MATTTNVFHKWAPIKPIPADMLKWKPPLEAFNINKWNEVKNAPDTLLKFQRLWSIETGWWRIYTRFHLRYVVSFLFCFLVLFSCFVFLFCFLVLFSCFVFLFCFLILFSYFVFLFCFLILFSYFIFLFYFQIKKSLIQLGFLPSLLPHMTPLAAARTSLLLQEQFKVCPLNCE
jgi:hypothetical protein